MKLLLDSCISKFAVSDLRNAGHDVIWIPETGSDPGDEEILNRANVEGRVLVTVDKDFGELVFIFGKPHLSIIRLVNLPARMQGPLLLSLIDKHQFDIEKHALITVEKSRIRLRLTE